MREKLGNLEGIYFKLQEVHTLLNLMANGYFDQNVVDMNNKRDILKLTWEYKDYQTLLFVSMDSIYTQIKEFENNLYGLYDDIKNIENGVD